MLHIMQKQHSVYCYNVASKNMKYNISEVFLPCYIICFLEEHYYVIIAVLLWIGDIVHLLICQLIDLHQWYKNTILQCVQFDQSPNLVNCLFEPMD